MYKRMIRRLRLYVKTGKIDAFTISTVIAVATEQTKEKVLDDLLGLGNDPPDEEMNDIHQTEGPTGSSSVTRGML